MDDVLLKDALELISNREPAFYSRLFLVKKASGGWKHMMDLLPLSTFMALKNFKIETNLGSGLLNERDDIKFSIVLKDSYFQSPIDHISDSLWKNRHSSSKLCTVFGLFDSTPGLHQDV